MVDHPPNLLKYRPMVTISRSFAQACLMVFLVSVTTAAGQALSEEYQAVLTTLGKKGDFKDGVFKVNIPRGDLPVKIGNRPAPTPFGFGGWVALGAGQRGRTGGAF